MTPSFKGRSDRFHEYFQSRKVMIVNASSSQKLPYSLYGIELRTVRRKKIKAEVFRDLFPPLLVKFGVVVAGIVGNDNDLTSRSLAAFLEFAKEIPTSLGVKVSVRFGHNKFSVSKSYSSEIADAFSGRCMSDDGVFEFWWNPHRTA